jgi:hypothetical protein
MTPDRIKLLGDFIALGITETVGERFAGIDRRLNDLPTPKDGRDGRDAKGEPGRDAIQIDVLPAIDPSRSYPRATYANYRGGRIRSLRTTDPIADGDIASAGWVVDVEGEAAFEVEQLSAREFVFKRTVTSGRVTETRFKMPVVLDCGVFKEGNAYDAGDGVTYAGSFWIAQTRTGDKPDAATGALAPVDQARARWQGRRARRTRRARREGRAGR